MTEGEELAIIPRSSTLHHSPKLEKAFKLNLKVKNHPWISVILSIMAEWSDSKSFWAGYVNWLPEVGDLTLPHTWPEKYNHAIELIGLNEHIENDLANIDQDFEVSIFLDFYNYVSCSTQNNEFLLACNESYFKES